MAKFFSGLLYVFSIANPLSWFGTLIYEHSSYERNLQVIHGPWIFSAMGGGPVQLWGSMLVFVIGAILWLFARKLQNNFKGK